MKKRLLALLKTKEEQRTALLAKSQSSNEVAELKSINIELQSVNGDITELRSMIDALPADAPAAAAAAAPAPAADPAPAAQSSEQRTAGPVTPAQVLATFQVPQGQPAARAQDPADPYDTFEYRTAFREFATTGCITSALRPEARVDAMTATTDVSAVIPTTIVNEVIKKVTVYGQIYSRVRKTSIAGGVQVPILSIKPEATWIGEATPSSKQKVQANTNVSFSYYGLECKVSVSLLANTVTLAGFESTIIDLITEAMVKAIDIAVIKGAGTASMLGITVDTRVPAAQVVTLTAADFADWSAWKKKVTARMPLGYKAGAVWIMASGTFEGHIDGMVDANGQPIGRVNYGITEGPQERFGGKPVIQVEDDVIANYDDAATSDVVAVLCNLTNYVVNSNMQMTMFRYLDHDTNEWVDKAILVADGKLLDPNGVVIVKKGA